MPQRLISGNRGYSPERKIDIVSNFLFFTCFFLYIWLRISPRLLYYRNPELFVLDVDFFRNFLLYPGGISNYIYKFLSEFHYFSWPGAFVVTLFVFLICVTYNWFLKDVLNRHTQALFFLPAILILITYNRYFPIPIVGVLLALIGVNIYIKISRKNSLFNVFLYILLSVFIYYCAVNSYWFFAALCGIWEIIKNKRYALGWLYLGIEILVYYINATYVLYIGDSSLIYYLFPLFGSVNFLIGFSLLLLLLASIIFLLKIRSKEGLFALLLVAFVFCQFWAEQVFNKALYAFFLLAPLILSCRDKTAIFRKKLSAAATNKILYPGLTVLLASAILLTFNKDENAFLKINYFSQNRMWQQLLKESRKIPLRAYQKNKALYEKVFKALYYTGRLPYEQFNYPSHLLFNMPYPLADSKLTNQLDPAEIADTCFSLGLFNHAELMSFWVLERANEPVRGIRQLALIYILKGNKQAAQTLLNRLQKSLLYKKWAKRYEELLENNTLLEKEPYLTEAKSRMIKQDVPEDGELLRRIAYKYDYEGVFKRLLAENKNNRMAFEYLMSYYLLMGQTERILENIGQLDRFGYTDIPHTYQEAVLINIFKTANTNPDLQGKKIDPKIAQRYYYFNDVYREYNYDKIATYNALKEQYGGSYFLYYIMLTKDRKDEILKD